MRSWRVTLGVVAGSLALTYILNKFFNVKAFFLIVPFILPLAWGWRRDDGGD